MQLYMLILELAMRLGAFGAPIIFILTLPITLPIIILLVYLKMEVLPNIGKYVRQKLMTRHAS